jgi:hypothetical protein
VVIASLRFNIIINLNSFKSFSFEVENVMNIPNFHLSCEVVEHAEKQFLVSSREYFKHT